MKKIFLVALLWAMFLSAYSQRTSWFRLLNSTGSSCEINDVYSVTNVGGGVFVLGTFTGSININPGGTATNITSAGGTDFFLAYYDQAGILVSHKTYGGTGDEAGVAMDYKTSSPTRLIVTGTFSSSNLDFNPGGTAITKTPAGGKDVFIISTYVSGVTFVTSWAQTFGNTNDDNVNDLKLQKLASSDSILVCGSFSTLTDFVGNTNSISYGGTDGYLLKLDMNGNYKWVKKIGGVGNDVCRAIACKPSTGDIYIISDIASASTTFDNGSGNSTSGTFSGTTNNFIVTAFNAAGTSVSWYRNFGGNSYAKSIYAGTNVTLAGEFFNSFDLNPTAGTQMSGSTPTSVRQIFVTNLSSTGTYVDAYHATSASNAYIFDLVEFGSNYHIIGTSSGNTDLNYPANASNELTDAQLAGFYLELNSSLDYVTSSTNFTETTTATSDVRDLTVDGYGDVILGGKVTFTGSLDVLPLSLGGIQSSVSPSGTDGFVQKITNCTTPTLNVSDGSRCGTGTVFLSAGGTSAANIKWYTSPTGGAVLSTGYNYTTPSLSTTTTYYVQIVTSTCASDILPVVATINPIPTMTSAISKTICTNSSVALNLTSSIPSSYTWYALPNSNVTGESTTVQSGAAINNTLTNTSSTNQTVTYSITPTSTVGGCDGTSQTVNVTVILPPTMTSVNQTSICSGTSVGLNLTASSPSTFSWVATTTPVVTGESNTSQTGSTLSDILTSSGSLPQVTVYYTVTPSSSVATGCAGTPQNVTVYVKATPVVTSANSKTVCSGTSVNLALTQTHSGGSFSWVAASNANVTGESTTQQSSSSINDVLTLSSATGQTLVYSVTPSNSGCIGTAQSVNISVNPAPAMTSATSASVCSGSTLGINLTANQANTTFSWVASANSTVNGESTTPQNTALINNLLSLVNSGSGAQTVNYSVTPTNSTTGCSGTPQNLAVTVNVSHPITANISASSTTVCSATPITFSATTNLTSLPTTFTYQWKLNGANVGTNTATYTLNSPVAGDQISCIVTNSGSLCTLVSSATSSTITLTASNVSPSVSIASPQSTLCAGSSITLNASPTNGGSAPTYQWKVNGTNAGTNSSTFTSSTLTNGDVVTCVMTSNANCLSTPTATSNTYTVAITAIPTITSTSPGSNCGFGTITLSANPSAGSINWYAVPSGGSILGSGTSFVTPALSTTTTYYAEAINNGCVSSNRTAVVATSNVTPTLISNQSAASCGPASLTIGATSTSGTISWYDASVGGNLISTGTSYTTPLLSTTTYYYAEASENGCTNPSRMMVQALIEILPTITSVTNGSVCGTNSVNIFASPSNGDINWYDAPTGGNLLLASNGTYTTPVLSATTSYYAEAVYNSCVSTSRTMVIAAVNPLPDVTVTQSGPTITSNQTGAIYQWIECVSENPIIGETGPSFTATVDGSYAVNIDLNGCTSTSPCVNITTVGVIENEELKNILQIYPNPSNGNFIINSSVENMNYTIINILGKTIKTGRFSTGNNLIQLTEESNGIYFIQTNGVTYKLIKN